jgi:hypothetical protein
MPHQLPDGSWETDSHGCVGMPIPDAKRLYDWTPVGTPIIRLLEATVLPARLSINCSRPQNAPPEPVTAGGSFVL